MNASPNEVQLILDSINDVRDEVKEVKRDVGAMDTRINGRIRKLENFRWQLIGGSAVVSFLFGVALAVALTVLA